MTRRRRSKQQFNYVEEKLQPNVIAKDPPKQSEYKEAPGRIPNFAIDVIGIPLVLGFFTALAWGAWTNEWGKGIAVGAIAAGLMAFYRTFFVLDRIEPEVHQASWGDVEMEIKEHETTAIPASWSLVMIPTSRGVPASFYQPRAGSFAAWIGKVIRDYEDESKPFGDKVTLSERTAVRKEGWTRYLYLEMIAQFKMLGLVYDGRNRVPEPTAAGIRVFTSYVNNIPPAPVINE